MVDIETYVDWALMDVRLLRVVVGQNCKRSSKFSLTDCSQRALGRVIVTVLVICFFPARWVDVVSVVSGNEGRNS